MKKGGIPDAGDALRDRDAGQAAAVGKGRYPDAGDTLRNRDARQAAAPIEEAVSKGSDPTAQPKTNSLLWGSW